MVVGIGVIVGIGVLVGMGVLVGLGVAVGKNEQQHNTFEEHVYVEWFTVPAGQAAPLAAQVPISYPGLSHAFKQSA